MDEVDVIGEILENRKQAYFDQKRQKGTVAVKQYLD